MGVLYKAADVFQLTLRTEKAMIYAALLAMDYYCLAVYPYAAEAMILFDPITA